MGTDLFKISLQNGIYHRMSLWSMLSPHLVKKDDPETPNLAQESSSKDTTGTVASDGVVKPPQG
jgi:hypothetical protein